MSYLDLAIIYLACGSPFGVYRLTLTQRADNVALVTLAAVLFWPWFAFQYLLIAPTKSGSRGRRAGEIRERIEAEAFRNASPGRLFRFREVFDKYVGLTEAAVSHDRELSHDLFSAIRHPNGRAASACLARVNRRKIDHHRARARKGLIDSLLSTEIPQEKGLAMLQQLFELLSDDTFTGEALRNEPRKDAVEAPAAVIGRRSGSSSTVRL